MSITIFVRFTRVINGAYGGAQRVDKEEPDILTFLTQEEQLKGTSRSPTSFEPAPLVSIVYSPSYQSANQQTPGRNRSIKTSPRELILRQFAFTDSSAFVKRIFRIPNHRRQALRRLKKWLDSCSRAEVGWIMNLWSIKEQGEIWTHI